MGTSWEQALQAFAGSNQTVTDRSRVGSDGGPSWFRVWGCQPGVPKPSAGTAPYDVWVHMTNAQGQTVLFGVNLDFPTLESSSGPLHGFIHEPDDILARVFGTLQGNDTTSLGSFDTASSTLRRVSNWLEQAKSTVQGWAKDINVPGSDWQGSAAGEFKTVLEGFANEVDRLHVEMVNPQDLAVTIDQARTQLHQSLVDLHDAHQAWQSSPLAGLAQATQAALMTAMQGAQFLNLFFADFISTAYGNPNSQDFWDRVQSEAKRLWTSNVAAVLDPAADKVMQQVNSNFAQTTAAIPQALQPVSLQLPASATTLSSRHAQNTNPMSANMAPSSMNIGTGAAPGNGTVMARNAANAVTPLSGTSTVSSSQSNGGADQAAAAALHSMVVPSSGPAGMSSGTGGGVASGTAGMPGAAGMPGILPAMSPARTVSTVKPSSVIGGLSGGTNNAQILGPRGKPLVDANGNPITVPPGSKIKPDGSITDAYGKPLLGSDGQPITVPKGSQLRLAADSAATSNSVGQPLSMKSSKLAVSTPGSLKTSSEGLQTTMGMSARAKQSGGVLTEPQPTAGTAAETAAAQGLGGGRATSSSGQGSPMPPMGGGAGGGGGHNGDRKRQAHLDEDPEVWGTHHHEGSATGVIGGR